MPQIDILRDLVLELVGQGNWDEIPSILTGQHPADLADIITRASEDHRTRLFNLLEEDLKADVLAELEGEAGIDVLEALTDDEISDIVEDMAPDDAADVIAELPDERSEKVLTLMEKEESDDVRELLKYGEETAGGIMTPDVVALPESLTVAEALDRIAQVEHEEPFYYLYNIDSQRRLTGYIGVWELLTIRDRNQPLTPHVRTDIVSVTTDTDQEEVAQIMSKYDLSALPVVDETGRLVGRITNDDVMDVMEEEASEDIFRLAGSDDAELTYTSSLQAARTRLPWLLITLGTGFISSLLLKQFMEGLSAVIVLTVFVPIVMAMGGSTGIQSSTLVIRSLALDTINRGEVGRLLLREICTGAMMGVLCGVLMAGWAAYVIMSNGEATLLPPAYLGLTVGLALFCSMTFAALYGAFVPLLLERYKVDPAVASGPFLTASNDIAALVIYYGVAVALIFLHPLLTGAGG